MKAVVFYERDNSIPKEKVIEIFPRHRQLIDTFQKEGKILAIGTFANSTDAMGIFVDKESAEEFVNQDPFVKEGVVSKITFKEWNEILL